MEILFKSRSREGLLKASHTKAWAYREEGDQIVNLTYTDIKFLS